MTYMTKMPIGSFNQGTLHLSEPSLRWRQSMMHKNLPELMKAYCKNYKVFARLKSGHVYQNRMAWILARIQQIRDVEDTHEKP